MARTIKSVVQMDTSAVRMWPVTIDSGESLFLLKDFFGHPARKNRQKLRDR
jgi:hypothetical protein